MTTKNMIRASGAAMMLLLTLILFSGCGAGDSDQVNDTAATATAQTEQKPSPQADNASAAEETVTPRTATNENTNRFSEQRDGDDSAADETQSTDPMAALNQSQPAGYQSSDRTAPRNDAAGDDGAGHSGAGVESAGIPAPDLPEALKRKAAPKMELVDIAGHKMTLDSFNGQAVLVVFWATWCPPCKAEIPHLVHLQDKYGESGLKILGLSLDQKGLPEVKKFLKTKREINYTIIPNGGQAARSFGKINSIPTTILLDKKGRILKRFVGLRPESELEGWVVAAMNEKV
jgi:thiol-disulfide isomerase/thioredoxin